MAPTRFRCGWFMLDGGARRTGMGHISSPSAEVFSDEDAVARWPDRWQAIAGRVFKGLEAGRSAGDEAGSRSSSSSICKPHRILGIDVPPTLLAQPTRSSN
jgi:hypothetical protein